MKISKLKELIKLVEESEIAELEIHRFGTKIRISKGLEGISVPKVHKTEEKKIEIELPPKKEKEEVVEENLIPITAPMVGTFYRAPSPDADPYIEVGDILKKGQVVCIIEAMKIMNEIEAEIGGKVAKVLVESGHPVEYGQHLLLVEPL